MERLTYSGTKEARSDVTIRDVLNKLADYEDFEEQNRMLKLPCAIGDKIWDNDSGRSCSYTVSGFSFGDLNDDSWEEEKVLDQLIIYYTNLTGSITGSFPASEIGNTVFITKSEMEQMLALNEKDEHITGYVKELSDKGEWILCSERLPDVEELGFGEFPKAYKEVRQ